ncbi:hypothetical protein D3C73_1062550 [compost metagenome]
MHGQAHACFFSYRHNCAQEYGHIIAQVVLTDTVILRQARAKLVQRITFFCTRQTGDNIASQLLYIGFAHGIEIVQSLTLFFCAVIRFRTGALQDMQLKGRKSNLIEAQGFRTVRELIFKVSARPVEDRHEVIAHGINAAGRQITDTLLIIGDPRLILSRLGFDVFVNGNAFHHRPGQPLFSQNSLSLLNLFYRPHFTIRNVVQGGHNTGCASLTHIIKRYRIVRSVPTPGLFHCFTSQVVIPN